MSAPDLFVVCKNCGSEVSPYITECPYCGQRLRKRAPKLEKPPKAERAPRVERARVRLPKLRPGEIPGIRAEGPPWGTILLVAIAVVATLVLAGGGFRVLDLALVGDGDPWRITTYGFVYTATGYEFVALSATFLFGWLLERRHGPVVVILLWFVATAAGGALAMLVEGDAVLALGGLAGALAFLCAWMVPDLQDHRRGIEVEGDLIGVAVIGVVLALMPLATLEANAWTAFAGALVGFVAGLPLAARVAR